MAIRESFTRFNAILRSLVLPALLAVPMTASAQTVDQMKFKRFVDSPLHTELLARAITAIPKTIFSRCPALKSSPSKLALAQSVEFGPDGVPNLGAWWEHLSVSGCGNDTVLNVFFVVAPDKTRINTIVAFPGTTRASIALQKDALQFALLALEAKETCSRAHIRNTRFGAFGLKVPAEDVAENAVSKPWWEVWTLAGCDKTFDVLMQFVPDATGTKIIAPAGGVSVRS